MEGRKDVRMEGSENGRKEGWKEGRKERRKERNVERMLLYVKLLTFVHGLLIRLTYKL